MNKECPGVMKLLVVLKLSVILCDSINNCIKCIVVDLVSFSSYSLIIKNTNVYCSNSSGDDNLSIANVLSSETQPGSSDLSKTQLLEALCYSQTRAREAEQLAQQAYNEKEHVIKLLFRQASQLFAYRQWLQILQLEALVLQLRNKDEQDSINYSNSFPVIPCKGRKLKKFRYNKPTKKKTRKGKFKINKSAVAFALGLSLAGAGLLLGWTMGWLFPAL